jgi:ferredoxin
MKIIADRTRCAGHARCAAVSESLFELDDNGYIRITEQIVPEGLEELARRGVRACPERALKVSLTDGISAPGRHGVD